MSWENNKCPCGCRKERETSFCSDCDVYLAKRPEFGIYLDPKVSLDVRRHANITLVILAKRRVPRIKCSRLGFDA